MPYEFKRMSAISLIKTSGNNALYSLGELMPTEGLVYSTPASYSSCDGVTDGITIYTAVIAHVYGGRLVTVINRGAFNTCPYLVSVTIPDTITHIYAYAFAGCKILEDVTFLGTIEQWNSISKLTDWASNVPATVVHCSDGDTPLINTPV